MCSTGVPARTFIPAPGPHDRVLLEVVDEQWRTARDLAERANHGRAQAPAALRRLIDAGLVEERREAMSGNRTRSFYRRRDPALRR